MIISEVLLVVGALVVAMFGFLNGWLVRRLFTSDDDVSVGDVSIYPGPASARWANGPRAVLLPTRDDGERETAHARGMTAVARFDRVGGAEPGGTGAAEVAPEEAEPLLVELQRLLAHRDADTAAPPTRVRRPEPSQALEHSGLSRCEQRIDGLESVLSELAEMVTTFDHSGDLERRIEAREQRRRMRRLDRSPSMSAVA